MSFLTRIQVDNMTAAQRHLSDSYAWHKAFWTAFPATDDRNFIYRIEQREGAFLAYLVSDEQPVNPGWGIWESKSIGDAFLNHSTFRFQLCANPTVKRKREGRKNGTRTAIYDPQELQDWLCRKATQGGFSVDESALQISPPLNQPFYKKGTRGNHKRVEFQGTLRVTDLDAFKTTFKNGIGSAKAFGFGLLVLQPIK